MTITDSIRNTIIVANQRGIPIAEIAMSVGTTIEVITEVLSALRQPAAVVNRSAGTSQSRQSSNVQALAAQILLLIQAGRSQQQVSQTLGVPVSTVNSIVVGDQALAATISGISNAGDGFGGSDTVVPPSVIAVTTAPADQPAASQA